MTSTDLATRAAKDATSRVPLLMVAINYDPITLGLIDSIARPGANVTGLFFQHLELLAKRFGLFKEMLPTVTRVAVLSDPLAADQLRQETASIFRGRVPIAQLALENRLPTSFAFREYVEVGGLASYGVNFSTMYRRAAEFVDKILRGTKPADLPVEQSTKFELVINFKTAKALGLEIPTTLLASADEVIE